MNEEKTTTRFWLFALIIVSASSLCAVIPWLHYGIPAGHDFEFHFNSWVEVLNHWRQGVVYPHWAAWAHYGYGEARFLFYPPISWTLGGILSAILPWKIVPGIFAWLVLTLAGVSMFGAARYWLAPGSALFAAIFYALNPYHLIIVYWRSALAELLAAIYLPLLLLCVVRLEPDGKRMIGPIALLLAAGWLTNIPSAVMMHYLLGILVLWTAISRRRWNVLIHAGVAVVIGVTLAAVYLLPVWHQRNWIGLDQVLSPGVRPEDNFLFTRTADIDHDKFNLLVSITAASEFVLLAIALLIWRAKRQAQLWWSLLVLGSCCVFFMLSFTSPLWAHLPQLRYLQFPWRWMLVFNVVLVMAVIVAVKKWWTRGAVLILAALPLVIGAQRILAPWWDNTGDLWQMVDDQHDKIGNEGVDEYAPAGVDPYDLDQNAPLAKYAGAGFAKVVISRWDSEYRVVTATSSSSGALVFKTFNYPLWQAWVNGKRTGIESGAHGEITVPIEAGDSRIDLKLVGSWDRRVGVALSIASLFGLALWYKKYCGASGVVLKANGG